MLMEGKQLLLGDAKRFSMGPAQYSPTQTHVPKDSVKLVCVRESTYVALSLTAVVGVPRNTCKNVNYTRPPSQPLT